MRMLTWLAPTLLVGACYRGSTTEATEPTPPPKTVTAETHAHEGAKRFVTAISHNDKTAVRGMLAANVRIGEVELVSDPCRAQFGQQQTVTGDRLDTLAGCLVELDRDSVNPGAAAVTRADDRWVVDLETECASYKLELTERASGAFAVVALAARSKCGGEEGGVVGGVIGGDDGSMPPPPPPPPPPPAPPQNVAPAMLEGSRISGTKLITPDDATKVAISQGAKDRYIGSFKLCIDVTGNITQIRMLKSTGLPDYDAKLQREMAKWRYRPYLINGKAVPVCTAVTFIYSQRAAPPPPSP